MDVESLIKAASLARINAYAPYSKFAVGAAILASTGEVFTGCNVENVSFGLTVCAERSAVCQAVAASCRVFSMIAIVSDSDSPISPCGACRQVLAEFASDLMIISANTKGDRFTSSLSLLLPRSKIGILNF